MISDLIPQQETDINEELKHNEKEVMWIQRAGKNLSPRVGSDPKTKKNAIDSQTQNALERWKQIKQLWELRLKRIKEAKKNSKDLTRELMSLRAWMKDMEIKLNEPVTMKNIGERERKEKIKEYMVS